MNTWPQLTTIYIFWLVWEANIVILSAWINSDEFNGIEMSQAIKCSIAWTLMFYYSRLKLFLSFLQTLLNTRNIVFLYWTNKSMNSSTSPSPPTSTTTSLRSRLSVYSTWLYSRPVEHCHLVHQLKCLRSPLTIHGKRTNLAVWKLLLVTNLLASNFFFLLRIIG